MLSQEPLETTFGSRMSYPSSAASLYSSILKRTALQCRTIIERGLEDSSACRRHNIRRGEGKLGRTCTETPESHKVAGKRKNDDWLMTPHGPERERERARNPTEAQFTLMPEWL